MKTCTFKLSNLPDELKERLAWSAIVAGTNLGDCNLMVDPEFNDEKSMTKIEEEMDEVLKIAEEALKHCSR